jgi:hypothetical protein
MAQGQLGSISLLLTNARKAVPSIGNTSDIATPSNYASISALRTRLAAANAYYTSSVLDVMSVNDMIYALRTIDDTTSISQ